uniref:separase n=1 Tax=Neolamprologus brichardi TaxID=32507 RepID=A0A3Q4MVM5_NEOBR
NYVKGKPGLQGRTLCDRIIRACNHQLGVGGLDLEHIAQLVKLMELSLHGYDIFAALVLQSNPLYMEKIVFHIVKKLSSIEVHVLCKAGHHRLASSFLSEIERKASEFLSCQCTAVVLAKWGVMIHSTVKAGDEARQALTECARAVRSVSGNLGDREGHALLEGCSFVVWAVDSGYDKGLSGPVLLALFSFFEEHQECNLSCQAECSRLQKSLCFSIYKGFEFAYESMLASEDSDTLERVLLYCQATAGLMMTELHKLSSENIVIKAIAVSNLACGLYNRRLYEKAFILVEILCRDLCKNCPASLSVDRLSRPFMLAVQTSRRTGQYDRALDWVILWLKALGDKITAHMTEPVSLWVKTKTDAACNSEGDIRLTLRDGFGPDVPDENVMLRLLEEELSAYKEMPGDTAQERYNTLCDLLDICHEESSHIHLRAVYLCEMAKVVCFQDFSEQTDSSAVDFIHEALRLLDEEPETPENADKLKDDKAHALLWLYICTLEKTLQENDFDYEDKQKTQDSIPVYEGLHFNLTAEHLCQPLESALDIWTTIFQSETLPSVREPKETCRSIGVTASLFRLMGKIDCGLRCLIEVLKELKKQQKQSKSWYLLRARTLQTSASFLSIDGALYESLKLLCSLLVTLVGKGLYGTTTSSNSSTNVAFINQDNLALKWQLLAELLNCSKKMVSVRSDCGAINDARLQCLEALKLAIKLQTLSCSELLVIKAELELMQGEKDESRTDLDIVRNLLERSTKILEAGLAFVESTPSPMLRPVRAGLMTAKAIASLISLAAKNECTPEELFSKAWTWNMPKEGKDLKSEQKTDPPASVLKKSKDVIKNSVTADPKKEAKKTRSVKSKIRVTSSSTKEKSQVPITPVTVKSYPFVKELSSYDFNTAVPTLALTPVQKVRCPASAQKPSRTAPKLQFHVYEELSPVQGKAQPVPAAPKRTKKSRFKVEFSDESDSEANAQAEPKVKAEASKTRTTARRAGHNTKTTPDAPAEKVPPKRQVRGKKSTVVPRAASSEDETLVCRPGSTRRTRKQASADAVEEPDTMRTIEEETPEILDMSIEQLRTSDAEDNSAASKDNNLTLEDVQSLLHSAWLTLQHFPPPTLYPTLCALLALTTGQQNSITTAMLHSHSVGITSRHRTIRHIASCLKLKKASSELEDKMHTLSLNELTQTVCEQRLTQMENIFSFPTADPSTFPETHGQEFIQQIQHLPSVTACVMSVMGVKPGEMGNSIMLTRLEKSSAPVTLVQEMDSILVEQKVVSCVSEKAKWWEGRRTLDSRVELLQRDEPRNHVVLILDKYLQKLPWESIPVLKSSSVSRMPSLHSLLGLSIQKESILRRGVDAKKVFYVLDPDDNLGNSQERFKDWFCKPDWEGVCGAAPALGRLEEAVATKDVYSYVGHGAGARFLDSQAVLKRPLRAASLLFGCSSGALAVRGQQEGNGIVLNYIIAGPFILGNLWDVTDRDIDRFTKALLESWFSAGSGAPLLDFMGSSRQATHLKYLIGSAPVVYGLPVHLS